MSVGKERIVGAIRMKGRGLEVLLGNALPHEEEHVLLKIRTDDVEEFITVLRDCALEADGYVNKSPAFSGGRKEAKEEF